MQYKYHVAVQNTLAITHASVTYQSSFIRYLLEVAIFHFWHTVRAFLLAAVFSFFRWK